jgi:DNA-nicking Smr family endonuclease
VKDHDSKLFRREMADAKPLRQPDRVHPAPKKPGPRARFARAEQKQVLRESLLADVDTIEAANGDGLHFRRPSVSRRTMRRLARGKFSVQAEIDLHGMTVAEAKPRLAGFLEDCVRQGRLCVRVVHGKGRGSGERGPVLKRSVDKWLRRWDAVLAFVSTPQVDGGTGAVYVLLRKP